MDNSWAQLEHQATRIANLELMARYGCEAWKAYNAALVRMLHQLQKQLQDLRSDWHDRPQITFDVERVMLSRIATPCHLVGKHSFERLPISTIDVTDGW